MITWFWYAVVAAVLYGAHQIFTRLASERIGDGLGRFRGRSECGIVYLTLSRIPLVSRSVESKIQHTRIQLLGPDRDLCRCWHHCVFSSLSKRWSAFRHSSDFGGRRRETASWQRVAGVVFAIVGLFLLRK